MAEPRTPLEWAFAEALKHDKFADSAGQAERWRGLLSRVANGEGPVSLRWQIEGQTRLASTLEYSDQADAARIEADKALDLIARKALAGSDLEAEALIVMATIQADNKQLDEAAVSARKALHIAQRLYGSQSALASHAHNALGTVAFGQGRYSEADREYEAAAELAVACQAPDDPAIVNQLASHAGTLYMIGRTKAALGEAQRAANWAAEHLPEDSPLQTLALGNLGAILTATGRYAEAQKALARVVDLEARYQRESWFYRAVSLSNYAVVLSKLGRLEEAETLWLASVELHGKATIGRDPTSASFPMRDAADAAQERGDLPLALERRNEAVRMVDEAAPADDPERARTHFERANTLLLMGKPQAALAEAEPAMAVLRARYGQDNTRRMTTEIAFARILARNGRAQDGYAQARAVAQRMEARLLDAATNRGDLVRYGGVFSSSFATMVELALETGHQEDAFHYMQLANMSDVALVTSDVAMRAAAGEPRTAAQVRDFQDRLRQRQALDREHTFALSAGDSVRAAQLAAQIASNDKQIAALDTQIDALDPRLRALARPTPVSLARYREQMGAQEALVAPLLLDDAIVTIVVTRKGLAWQRSQAPRNTVRGMIGAIHASVDPAAPEAVRTGTMRFAYGAARRVSQLILPERLLGSIGPARDVVYFASGDLASLPAPLMIVSDEELAQAKPDPAHVHWLIRDHSVRVAPSLVALARPAKRETAHERFLGVGGPVLVAGKGDIDLSDLAPLPGAEHELQALAAVFGANRSRLLLGVRASEANLRALPLASFSVITFAMHGLSGGERAGLEEPALVLSTPVQLREPHGQDDGLLSASEIMQLKLNAEWIILSACDTAGGASVGAPIFSGLAAAFLHAGARSVLVSHWPVRDDVAARLVVEAVRDHAAGASRARALQAAQLALIGGAGGVDAAQPGLWGAMVLVEP